MTNFYKWLNEESIDEFIKDIIKNCKYYISQLNRNQISVPFVRGISRSKLKSPFGKKSVRQDRKPLATKKEVFNEINDYFEEKGHARRDKSVIATSNYEWTKFFGVPTYIFPIGKFNYTFVKTYDFNKLKYLDRAPQLLQDFMRNQIKDEDKIDQALELLDNWVVTNKKMHVPYEMGYEIWFDCKEYYYIDSEEWNIKALMNRIYRG